MIVAIPKQLRAQTMSTVLIVDDALYDRTLVSGIASKWSDCHVGIAQEEALNNAFLHGNLREQDIAGQDKRRSTEVAATRRLEPVFAERRIFLRVVIDQDLAEFTIRDEGERFDWHSWMDRPSSDPPGARGVALMRSITDSVNYNEIGNQIVLRKDRYTPPPTRC